jgi:hypothetical protein
MSASSTDVPPVETSASTSPLRPKRAKSVEHATTHVATKEVIRKARKEIASPMPDAPPLTTATLPSTGSA